MTAEVVTTNGGRAATSQVLGHRPAIRFPVYSGDASPPRAIVRVANASSSDHLSPGLRPFEFGATVRLFDRSTGSFADNGDNVIQRGLYDGEAQYKIELDRHLATCRIKGSDGDVTVRSAIRIVPRQWYTVVCSRVRNSVVLRVRQLSGPVPDWWVTGVHARIGAVSFSSSTPLTVGGKLGADGYPEPAADQFNGLVSRVFLEIG